MENRHQHSFLNDILLLIVSVCLATMFFISCKSARVVYVPVPGRDSVRVEVREKVVTVHDTAFLEIPSQKTETQTKDSISHLETDFAVSDAQINSDGSLSHSLENKPQKEIPYEKEIVYVTKDSTVYQDRPVPYEVEKELSGWQQMKIDYGGLAMTICAIAAVAALFLLIRHVRKLM